MKPTKRMGLDMKNLFRDLKGSVMKSAQRIGNTKKLSKGKGDCVMKFAQGLRDMKKSIQVSDSVGKSTQVSGTIKSLPKRVETFIRLLNRKTKLRRLSQGRVTT